MVSTALKSLPALQPEQKVELSSQEDDIIFNQLESTGFESSQLEVLNTFQNPITCIADAKEYEEKIKKCCNTYKTEER